VSDHEGVRLSGLPEARFGLSFFGFVVLSVACERLEVGTPTGLAVLSVAVVVAAGLLPLRYAVPTALLAWGCLTGFVVNTAGQEARSAVASRPSELAGTGWAGPEEPFEQTWVGRPGVEENFTRDAASGIAQQQHDRDNVIERPDHREELREQVDRGDDPHDGDEQRHLGTARHRWMLAQHPGCRHASRQELGDLTQQAGRKPAGEQHHDQKADYPRPQTPAGDDEQVDHLKTLGRHRQADRSPSWQRAPVPLEPSRAEASDMKGR
jgi:hypothetical protein